mmetsp:Transcript_39531/g.76839  ORF Transcript_39531/g.76839 Transcript_39531/m.76839 type:complete len:82 (-) Transcript_39531:171-416(-)
MQAWLLGLSVTATTSLRVPALMNEFENFFGNGTNGYPAYESEVWGDFQEVLSDFSSELDEKSFRYPFGMFNPKYLESSVSV